MDNGISTNGTTTNGTTGDITNGTSNGSSRGSSYLAEANGSGLTNGKSTTSSAETFTFPLPTRKSKSHSSDDHSVAPVSAPTESAPIESARSIEDLGRTIMRRNAMGVAAVRVAGRLAHTELLEDHITSSRSHPADPTVDADALFALLGEYLTAAGFDRPEIHVKLAGQSIVVDLMNPSTGR